MLSSVLNSKRAVQVNILIMRAFAQLRELMATHKDLVQKLEKLEKKKAKLKAAEGRIRARISARERKLRTRRLILMGSYLEHVTKTDPHSLDRLMKGLDEFLERDRDRELFDLAQKQGVTHGRL